MKLSELKEALTQLDLVSFKLPDGNFVPSHFHVTEVGQITRHFIDCGGTVRTDTVVNLQLWQANDFDHRLGAVKLKDIIELSEKTLNIRDAEIEVEYQQETICKYHINFDGEHFQLQNTQTDCLAPDKCGVPVEKKKIKLSELNKPANNCCTPGSGCC